MDSWFSRRSIAFIPKHAGGWIILLLAITCTIYSFLAIDSRSHSASDTLMNFAFRLVLIYLVYSAIAFVFSKPANRN